MIYMENISSVAFPPFGCELLRNDGIAFPTGGNPASRISASTMIFTRSLKVTDAFHPELLLCPGTGLQ